jgi:type VI secretion system secreted protein Hcp
MVIDLEGVLVASISTSGDRTTNRANETISLNFAKVRLSYSKDGRSADTQFGWSVLENKAL